MWTFDTAHQGALTSATYQYLVTHYGDPSFLTVMAEGLWVSLFPGLRSYEEPNLLLLSTSGHAPAKRKNPPQP